MEIQGKKMINPVYTNSLISEQSPYLLQHAHNPVVWMAWSDAAFQKAKQEDKLIIVSIGYSACHWCHVMERESFDNEEVAMVMNDSFISIKVDKEEHPEIDQQYMSAVRLITGNGGWPLNVICLPDGRPIYGGTYFPTQQWIDILNQINSLYHDQRGKVIAAVEDLAQGVNSVDFIESKMGGLDYLPKYLRLIVEPWKRKFDTTWGGTQSTPKFPMPASIDFLLSYAYHMQDDEVKQQALLTLTKIYEGGIYDHIGGGFHRYAVDGQWFQPHFEKMLYDNTQLAISYIQGYQYSKEPLFKEVAIDTLEFILRDFKSGSGLFYTAYDADSEGQEGIYYVWTYDELRQLLDGDLALFCSRFGIEKGGNFEKGENILFVNNSLEALALEYDCTVKNVKQRLDHCLKRLYCARFLREKPKLDSKFILSWNALAVKAFAIASAVFKEPRYLVAALDGVEGIEKMLKQDGRILRTAANGNRLIFGMLDDYAFLIDAYLTLYSVTFNFEYIEKANVLVEECISRFFDKNSGMFFYTPSDVDMPLGRKMDVVDGVMPSSNSSLARSLYFLSIILSKSAYRDMAVQMLANMQEQMSGAGPFIANWGMLLLNLTFAPAEVTLVGDEALRRKQVVDQEYLPNVLFFGTNEQSEHAIFKNRWKEGETTMHLCIDNVCRNFNGSIQDLKESALELRNCYIL